MSNDLKNIEKKIVMMRKSILMTLKEIEDQYQIIHYMIQQNKKNETKNHNTNNDNDVDGSVSQR